MSAQPKTWKWKDHYKGSTFSAKSIKFNFDITGVTIICQLKAQSGSSVIHEWKSGVNITVLDALIGHVVLNQIYKFKPAAGNYIFDVETDKPINQDDQTYISGTLKVVQDITVPTV
jgi:hypothetical protein